MNEPLLVNISDLTKDQQRDILYLINCCRVRNSPCLRQEQSERYLQEVSLRHEYESYGIARLDDAEEGVDHLDRDKWGEDFPNYTDDEAWK